MGNRKKKILLINPIIQYRKGFSVGRGTQAPLGLGIIAALTPSDFDVEILDEVHDTFELKDADLVGLTSFTFNVPRAYEIASMYRAKGIPVVLGGIHASMMPDEALAYVDSVVIGEAESVWNVVLSDFLANSLKKKYFGEYLDMSNSPQPRL
ncbi:MAG TPA: cobalamin-dependent protein, partial [Alphaproteobacteria bacterium]|nr:cobalamin-dependent protein [Alphaproteobacteria bacterium]